MNDRLGLGGNSPPSRIDMLRQELQETTSELTRTRDFWLAEVAKVPEVTDAASASKATQTAADVGKAIKEVDAAFKVAKAPYLEGGRTVDTYFKGLGEPLVEAKNIIERRLTVWGNKIRAEEEARRRAVAKKAREEAEAAQKAADEAARAMVSEDDMDAVIEADERAARIAKEAEAARQATEAKAAELSRSRGAYGATSSLRTDWVHGAINRETLDLEKLRMFFNDEALDKAVRAFIKAGGRDLRGVDIKEETTARVRG